MDQELQRAAGGGVALGPWERAASPSCIDPITENVGLSLFKG